MAKNKGGHAPKSIKKNNLKPGMYAKCGLSQEEFQRRTPGLRPAANKGGAFLKDRLNKKVKELKCSQSLHALQENATKANEGFEREHEDDEEIDSFETGCQFNPNLEAENTRRRFYTELRKVIANADVIIEVLDARDPGSCRSVELEKEILASGKKLVLLLNKIDLVPKHAVQAWQKHLQQSFPTLTFKAARSGTHRPTHAMTSAENAPVGLLNSTHAVVGADELMQLLKNYARTNKGKVKFHTAVGIVGYPNTGKSSIINSMKRHNAVPVGGRSGVTTVMQEVQLDSKVTLIDSPGVVFSGSSEDPSVVLRNVVRVENISDPLGVVEALMLKTPRESLLEFYASDHDFADARDFLVHVAQTRGKLARGSKLDLESAARSVIQDWTAGRFRYFVMPPAVIEGAATVGEPDSADVVGNLAPAFDIDALFGSSDDIMAGGGDVCKPVVLGAPVQGGRGDDAMDCEDGGGMVEVDEDGMYGL